MNSIFILFSLLTISTYVYADNWALLIAGSNEYYNYRHQADICHAYQVLHSHGIPDERIVVMMYDDIANNPENPTKGKIINKPGGPNVYPGVLKDYTKKAVTPKNFLNVLQGKAEALKGIGSGKVINSGPDDNIFVYFSDHGAPGIIAFPDGSVLHASELNKALKSMHENKRYKKMVIYIEACESGSMFDGLLPPNIDIYATTASNSEESSYACYYDDTYQTYLGDVYSVVWLEDSDAEDLTKETLEKQFQVVKKGTNTSHVMQFGNLTIAKLDHVGDYQGNKKAKTFSNDLPNYDAILKDAVPSEQVRVSILRKKLDKETNKTIRFELASELERLTKSYRKVKSLIREIASLVLSSNSKHIKDVLGTRKKLTKHKCYVDVVEHMISNCFDAKNENFLKNLHVIVNLCENEISVENLKSAVNIVCKHSNAF